MPIYEFYCEPCNTVFSFFSHGVNTVRIPACPGCRRPLKRQMSIFAKVSRGKEDPAGDDMPPIDEAKMEKAMAMLAGEAEKLNEDDPRQAAQLMRKLTDATGISPDPAWKRRSIAWRGVRTPTGLKRRWATCSKGRSSFSSKGKGKGEAGNRNPAWTKPFTTSERGQALGLAFGNPG